MTEIPPMSPGLVIEVVGLMLMLCGLLGFTLSQVLRNSR